MIFPRIILPLFAILLLVGCGQTVIRTTAHTPLDVQADGIPEPQLLDLAVLTFDPGLDNIDENDETTLPEVRNAEALFMASRLADTLQRSGSWGAVRVVPGKQVIMDVYVEGGILYSDGETLELSIEVTDTSDNVWHKKKYKEVIGKYAYEKHEQLDRDPFQGIFNRIANDLAAYKNKLSTARIEELRAVSGLRFARDFAPDAYSSYLTEGSNGNIRIFRLPADNDPTLARINSIRERDYLYVDTLQEYYNAFSRQMDVPYQTWRALSYDERLSLRELQRQYRLRVLAGIATVIGGVIAAGSDSGATQLGGIVAASAGGMLVKSGLSKKAEAQIHIEGLLELGESLEMELEPRIIELEDRTITLTGNVEAQYQQWKQLLKEIYRAEREQ